MDLLMTPAEAFEAAFGNDSGMEPSVIDRTTVYAAQLRYVEPVLGRAVCEAIAGGEHGDLLEEYVKPALAAFVKYAVMPAAVTRIGALGAVRFGGGSFEPADDKAVERLRASVRTEADTLLEAAVRRMEAAPEEYPEYDPALNVRRRVSIAGGVVL